MALSKSEEKELYEWLYEVKTSVDAMWKTLNVVGYIAAMYVVALPATALLTAIILLNGLNSGPITLFGFLIVNAAFTLIGALVAAAFLGVVNVE